MTLRRETIFTIGHSTHSYERFLSLLRNTGITAVADVRTSPYSRHFPQFSRDTLKDELRTDGIAYSFLGKELGGRPTGSQYYCDGVADYERMAKSPDFEHGIQRVLEGAQKYRIVLMCSEHDPLDCHRCLLVGRALAERGVAVKHIKSDGSIADHREIEERLLVSEGQHGDDLFLSPRERLLDSYRRRARKVAYAEQPASSSSHAAAE
ncbi:DUF488 domain-containing protein [Mesorhizobium sp.]|uniref:DUF488 domain-containing protein n=1 Tax=Mesorhizobium sp. TaxID=1871066 RepID=UPI000FE57636|nr:DUF488 domain-containing protein [Mesorhizobium sp.]RWG01075.1 MAG: DUF488 domain-containing protein [Mesorhizobium sp.]RWG95797.1 MAG: DUF488 domain-containing protein [Mesorhizobium sp.]TIN48353.1 MAG: DUF488 domain-containing protein [Mesorhizobium sp.]TIR90828.1 MAG: DUF488 domain-containing protein [Mesorhizobium sp.]